MSDGRATANRMPGYFPMKQKVIRSHATQTGESLTNLTNLEGTTDFRSALSQRSGSGKAKGSMQLSQAMTSDVYLIVDRKTSDPTFDRRPKSSDQISIDLTFDPIAEEPEILGSPESSRQNSADGTAQEVPIEPIGEQPKDPDISFPGAREFLLSFLDAQREALGDDTVVKLNSHESDSDSAQC